ncbi:MAG TPA: L,D-transpeptidase, partial [Synergistales bacterium]|nr:L,D-transpeptidase [Synergistales bacterium]
MNSAKKWILALLAVFLLGYPAGVFASDTKQPGEWSPKPSERWLEVVKKERRLYLRQGDQILKAYRVAIGSGRGIKKSPIDKITPVGVFTIRRIADARNWVFDPKVFNEPGEPQKDVYGRWAISFKNPWNLAIHGTNAPWSIGKAVTHGCIRLKNEDIEELIKHVKPGMKLVIREKPLP